MTLLRSASSGWKRLIDFLFPPETDKWLAVLRIGLGLQVTVYALFLKNDWHYLFASTGKGLVSRELGEAIVAFDSPLIPTLGWLVALGRTVNISEETVLTLAWAGLLGGGCFLLLGLFCRPAAIISWFLHLCAAESGGLLTYGADNFMTMGLFYLMLSPLPDRYSFDHRLIKNKAEEPASFRLLATCVTGAPLLRLLFRRPRKMPWQRLVEWIKSLAIPDTTAVQHHFTGYTASIQIPPACSRDFNLPARTWLCRFYLDEKDPVRLVDLHSGDARRHRFDDGNVSIRRCHDCIEPRRLRRRFWGSFSQAS